MTHIEWGLLKGRSVTPHALRADHKTTLCGRPAGERLAVYGATIWGIRHGPMCRVCVAAAERAANGGSAWQRRDAEKRKAAGDRYRAKPEVRERRRDRQAIRRRLKGKGGFAAEIAEGAEKAGGGVWQYDDQTTRDIVRVQEARAVSALAPKPVVEPAGELAAERAEKGGGRSMSRDTTIVVAREGIAVPEAAKREADRHAAIVEARERARNRAHWRTLDIFEAHLVAWQRVALR